MNILKKAFPIALAAVMALSASSCGKKGDDGFMSARGNYEAWKDIDLDTVVAKLESGADPDAFNITFKDFYSEYLYYLVSYNIDDDMSETYIDMCAEYRSDIIDFLTFERIFLYTAEHEYGITESTLSAEQKQEILDNSKEVIANWKGNYIGQVTDVYGYELTEAEISDKTEKLLEDDLRSCGLTKDVFYEWELSAYIQNLVIEKITEQAEVTDSELDEMYQQYYNEALEAYKNDKASYEQNSLYLSLYLPTGTRKAAHIFVPFEDSDLTRIQEAVDSGNDNLAAMYIADAREAVSATLSEIDEKLRSGGDFAELQDEYSDDYPDELTVIPDSVMFPNEYVSMLYKLNSPGDISEQVACQTGIYYIKYVSDVRISDEDKKALKDDMRHYLLERKQNELQSEKYAEWTELYEYDINYELLKIEDPNAMILDSEFDENELIIG